MFLTKQTTPTPQPQPEPRASEGLMFQLKLSEATLVKLMPWLLSVLIGAGGLGFIHAQVNFSPIDSPSDTIENTEGN